MRQLAKKLENFKATKHHIKQVTEDPTAVQINLLRHQCTEFPAGKYKKKRPNMKSKPSHHKPQSSESYHLQTQHRKMCDPKCTHNSKDRCSKCGDTAHWKDSSVQQKYQCKACHKFGHFRSMCFQKKSKQTSNPEGLKHSSCKQVQFM